MQLSFVAPDILTSNLLACVVDTRGDPTKFLADLDQRLDGQISRMRTALSDRGSPAQPVELPEPGGLETPTLVLAFADASNCSALELEELGASLAARCLRSSPVSVDLYVPDSLSPQHVARGFALRNYVYSGQKSEPALFPIPVLRVLCENWEQLASHARSEEGLCAGVHLARDLVNAPPNQINPESFAEALEELQMDGVEIQRLDEQVLLSEGMHAFLAVGSGSAYESSLVIIEYDGRPEKIKDRPLVLVGKGVTYDAGGLYLKPEEWLSVIKFDMGGAAAVAGAIVALAQQRAPVHVVGFLALAENMPDGRAFRGGDVLQSRAGISVEVLNTDAEGRLMLCDTIDYALANYEPSLLVDLATLTGSAIAFYGREYAPFLANSPPLDDRLRDAGARVGEKLWPMPRDAAYLRACSSEVADIANYGRGFQKGSAVTAAHFLSRFVPSDVSWAHIDIAGTVLTEDDAGLAPRGATGFGVRTLVELALER